MEYEVKRKLVELSRARRDEISDAKGAEYTKTGKEYKEGGDILANFKTNADRFGQSPFTVLGVYLGKHFDSVENFIKDLSHVKNYEEALEVAFSGEGIISRLDDIANYVDLLESLLFEYQLHPFSVAVTPEEEPREFDEPDYTVEPVEQVEPETEDEQLALEVEEAATAELAKFVGPGSPFKGSREVGNG